MAALVWQPNREFGAAHPSGGGTPSLNCGVRMLHPCLGRARATKVEYQPRSEERITPGFHLMTARPLRLVCGRAARPGWDWPKPVNPNGRGASTSPSTFCRQVFPGRRASAVPPERGQPIQTTAHPSRLARWVSPYPHTQCSCTCGRCEGSRRRKSVLFHPPFLCQRAPPLFHSWGLFNSRTGTSR